MNVGALHLRQRIGALLLVGAMLLGLGAGVALGLGYDVATTGSRIVQACTHKNDREITIGGREP